jgi:cysteine synthase A
MKVIAVEPCDSAVISGKESGTHKIQGIGAGFIPDNLKMNLIDDVICVEYKDAVSYSALCAQKEGILGGISSGAVLAAASLIAQKSDNAVIFLFNYDTGERYLSVPEMF